MYRYLAQTDGWASAAELAQYVNVDRRTASRVANLLVADRDDVVKGRRYRQVESPHAGGRKKRRKGRPETVFRLRSRMRSRLDSTIESALSILNGGKLRRLPNPRRSTAINYRDFDHLRRIKEQGREKMAADRGLKEVYDMIVAASRRARRGMGLTVDEAAKRAGTPRSTMYRRFRFLYDHHLLFRIPTELHRPKHGRGRPPDVFIAT